MYEHFIGITDCQCLLEIHIVFFLVIQPCFPKPFNDLGSFTLYPTTVTLTCLHESLTCNKPLINK